MNKHLTITDQINTQYRSYALYVLQSRGIPNFYDSLTPVQRLILENSPSRFSKTVGLVGEVIKTGLYHHGDSSLAGAISKLARPFGCSYGILEGDGFFGSPVNPSPSAPRYTAVKINQKIRDIITKNSDLNEKNEEGGHNWIHVEVPVGLLTHIVGIAVGYRSNILPRKFEDVVEYLQGSTKLLKPYFKDFSGKISKYMNEDNSWLLESGLEVDSNRKIIRIFDLPPVMRYDSFINKLESKLEKSGYDYRIENKSQSKCELAVQIKGNVTPEAFIYIADHISKLTKIIVKEDVIFVRDGNVMEFGSVREYLDHFKQHLELVKLKRLVRDNDDNLKELAFLEAKLLFLNFMIEKKRKNDEIIKFLSDFPSWISSRLQRIEIVKLSPEYIKETKDGIDSIKKEIEKVKKAISIQEKIYNKASIEVEKLGDSASKKIQNSLFETQHDDGIEIFQVGDEEFEETKEEENEEF
jgi:DNA gyrase/topoisomerase IV subunit A